MIMQSMMRATMTPALLVRKKRGFEPDDDSSVKDSKFASLAKKFKPNEICSDNIDECLANNVTDLYSKGMDD